VYSKLKDNLATSLSNLDDMLQNAFNGVCTLIALMIDGLKEFVVACVV